MNHVLLVCLINFGTVHTYIIVCPLSSTTVFHPSINQVLMYICNSLFSLFFFYSTPRKVNQAQPRKGECQLVKKEKFPFSRSSMDPPILVLTLLSDRTKPLSPNLGISFWRVSCMEADGSGVLDWGGGVPSLHDP